MKSLAIQSDTPGCTYVIADVGTSGIDYVVVGPIKEEDTEHVHPDRIIRVPTQAETDIMTAVNTMFNGISKLKKAIKVEPFNARSSVLGGQYLREIIEQQLGVIRSWGSEPGSQSEFWYKITIIVPSTPAIVDDEIDTELAMEFAKKMGSVLVPDSIKFPRRAGYLQTSKIPMTFFVLLEYNMEKWRAEREKNKRPAKPKKEVISKDLITQWELEDLFHCMSMAVRAHIEGKYKNAIMVGFKIPSRYKDRVAGGLSHIYKLGILVGGNRFWENRDKINQSTKGIYKGRMYRILRVIRKRHKELGIGKPPVKNRAEILVWDLIQRL